MRFLFFLCEKYPKNILKYFIWCLILVFFILGESKNIFSQEVKSIDFSCLSSTKSTDCGFIAPHTDGYRIVNDYPVWLPYQIVDIESPYIARNISAISWPKLRYLKGLGGLFLINRGNRKVRSVVYQLKTSYQNKNLINYADVFGRYGDETSFNQLDFNGFDDEKLKFFSTAFWRAVQGSDGDQYNRIINYTTNQYIYYRYYSCDPGSIVWFEWYPNSNKALQYKASQSGSRIVFFEKNDHTPYQNDGIMCANGRSVHDPNKHFVSRVMGAETLKNKPYRYYPLNSSTKLCDAFFNKECGVGNGIEYVEDRFGRKSAAVGFSHGGDQGFAIMPEKVFDFIKKKSDFTFAFWVKKDPAKVSNLVNYYPSVNDTWENILWIQSKYANGANFGLSLHRESNKNTNSSGHFAFSRKTEIGSKSFFWKQWMEAPTRLIQDKNKQQNLAPWTFVVLVYSKNQSTIYIYNEKMFLSGSVKDRVALRRFTYMSNSESLLAKSTSWGIGKLAQSDGLQYAIEAIDELTVFDKALEENQIRDLINAQIVDQMNIWYNPTK